MDGLNREISDFDIIIKNGTLVDGTGAKSKLGDIAVSYTHLTLPTTTPV